MASKKKPVWVDESAHAVLKKYAKLTKQKMLDVASTLVLDRLDDLDPSAGLDVEEPEEEPAEEVAAKPAAKKKTAKADPPQRKKPARRKHLRAEDVHDEDTRFLGGIWLV